MHPRIQEILTCLDAELATLQSAVASVPIERRNVRPAPDRWSVAEVLEHLLAVEKVILKVCTRQLAAARETGLPQESDTTSILDALPPERVANRNRRLVAPENLRPKGMDAAAAWSEIEATRAHFKEFVQSCDGLAISHISFPHPAFGDLNLFAAGHHARHAEQIREIGMDLE